MKILLFFLFPLLMAGQNVPCESILFIGGKIALSQKSGLPVLLTTGMQEPGKQYDECGEFLSGRRDYSVFSKGKKRYHFDFENQLLCELGEKAMADLLKSGYAEIDSDFSRQGVSIHLGIRRKDFAFRFDTGYKGSFCIASHDNIPFIKDNHQSVENIRGTTDLIYANKWISMNGVYYSGAATVSKIKTSKVGTGFLKGFDWVIDFDKQKVYFKKNGISLEAADRKTYETEVLEGKITVVSKNSKAKQYQLGDVITAVNGKKVTPENSCEIQELLMKTTDWEALEIETAHNE